ncbi:MAG: winged helix-turn-helix transcriptional regulator [Candidatus Anstonellales archaeon]
MENKIRIDVGKKRFYIDNVLSINSELVTLCRGIRLLSERDTGATAAKLMRYIMEIGPSKEIGCSELSRISGLNRITCIHHMKRLESAGIVKKKDSKYRLLFNSYEEIVEQLREKMLDEMEEFLKIARELDFHIKSKRKENFRTSSSRSSEKWVKIEVQ